MGAGLQTATYYGVKLAAAAGDPSPAGVVAWTKIASVMLAMFQDTYVDPGLVPTQGLTYSLSGTPTIVTGKGSLK